MKYLSNDILKGFDKYKYSSKDTSPLSNYVMHPFWDFLVQFFPIWLAPNLMTLMGFLMTVINFLLIAMLDSNFEASNSTSPMKIPAYIWIIIGVLNFTAHQLDGTDGKQARRTGTSSPLGELFDHGCDSWAVSMLPLTLLSIFGTDTFGVSRWQMFIVVWAMVLCFILSHWEKYLTGILYLPWGYDIGQNGATIGCIATFFCGTEGWKIYIRAPFNISVAMIGYGAVLSSVLLFSLPMTIYNILQSYLNKTGHMLCFTEAMRPLFSTLILFVSSFLWALMSPSSILENHTRLFLFVIGTVSSNITVRLIIAQMSQTRCELINVFGGMYGFLVAVILVFRHQFVGIESILLWSMCIVFTVGHFISASLIVRELCVHLKIQAFSISYKQNPQLIKREPPK